VERKSVGRRDSHHRQCRCRRKATGLRASAVSGYIQKVFAGATYQYVRKGQTTVTIYSPELVATEREYLVAKENQEQVARSTVPGVASSAACCSTRLGASQAVGRAAKKKLPGSKSTGQVQQELEVDSPIPGYITERNALPTVAVQPEMRLYTIADLSTIWFRHRFSRTISNG